jgi:V8-like Glu-specific endopeptidase
MLTWQSVQRLAGRADGMAPEEFGEDTIVKKVLQDTLSKFYALLFGTVHEREKQQLKLVQDPTAKPWSAICHLKSTYSEEDEKGVANGTGFLISDTTVITAAHNLCKLNRNGERIEPKSITVTLAGNAGQCTATRFTYDTRYAEFEELQYKNILLKRNKKLTKEEIALIKERFYAFEDPGYYDYGAIFLDKALAPKPDFFFKLRGTDTSNPLWDKTFVCAGYPGGHQLYCAEGVAHPDARDRFMGNQGYLVVHNVFALGGESGGPLYVVDGDGAFVAIGIFVRSNAGKELGEEYNKQTVYTNGAVRITSEMESLFKRWDEENRGRIDRQGPQGLIV